MRITRAKIEDAEEILVLQKLAFQSEAELYNDYEIPPLMETLEEIKAHFRSHIILKALLNGKIIGTVRAGEENGVCHISRLAVHPERRNQGIGASLLVEIEKYYKCRRFKLFTGAKSYNNIHLYQKYGYKVFKTAKFGCGAIDILYMEKYA